MAKQIGIIILTDTVEELRGMLNRFEDVFNDITVDGVPVKPVAATVTPAAAGAPAVPAIVTTPATTTECDRNGMPWDERIHSGAVNDDGSHKKTGKGVWQKRRSITPQLIAQVEAEIMATPAGDAALPSSTADLASPPGTVGIPNITDLPVAPPPVINATPVLVLPVPADLTQATMQDCINITQVYAQINGADEMQKILQACSINSINQLKPEHYEQYINYVVQQHDSLA